MVRVGIAERGRRGVDAGHHRDRQVVHPDVFALGRSGRVGFRDDAPRQIVDVKRGRRSRARGRPLGDESFVAKLETALKRTLRPLPRGPKPKGME
jgi:hypothetical protein